MRVFLTYEAVNLVNGVDWMLGPLAPRSGLPLTWQYGTESATGPRFLHL